MQSCSVALLISVLFFPYVCSHFRCVIRVHSQVKSLLRTKMADDIYFIIFSIMRTFNAFCCTRLGTVSTRIHKSYLETHTLPKRKEKKRNTRKKVSGQTRVPFEASPFICVYISISFIRWIGVNSNHFRFSFGELSSCTHLPFPKKLESFMVFYGTKLKVHFVLILLFGF